MNTNSRSTWERSALMTSVLLLAACASSLEQPAAGNITRADQGIELASESGAREYAAGELDSARNKLMLAKIASEKGDYEAAIRFAKEAELDAELAAARTSHSKAADALDEINNSLATLRAETERNTEPMEGDSR